MKFQRVFAITPNPALDLNGEVSRIVPNEKNYIVGESRHPGGNSVNSARILTHLGYPVVASGFLGGAVGIQFAKLLKSEKVRTDFVSIENETRINITVSNRASHQQTRFSFPGPTVSKAEKAKLLEKLDTRKKGTLFLLGGSFPPGFTAQDAKSIIESGHRGNIATVLDVPPEHLKFLLRSKPLLIKPNLFEFQQLVGKKVERISDIVDEAKNLLKYCPLICISSVDKGVLFVTRSGTYYAKGPHVVPKSSVGAGDSLVGGIVAGMLTHPFTYDSFFGKGPAARASAECSETWKSVLCLGMGAALATISQPGTTLGGKREILKFAKKIRIVAI